MTSLYGLVLGQPPNFFEGDARAFTDLYFNLEAEEFEFFTPMRMRNNPLWANVTQLFESDIARLNQLANNPAYSEKLGTYLQRGGKVQQIKDKDLHIEPIGTRDLMNAPLVTIAGVLSGWPYRGKSGLAAALYERSRQRKFRV